MLLIFFVLAILFGLFLFYIGYTQVSFPYVYLAFFCLLLVGLFLYSEGIDITTGTAEVPLGSHNFIDVNTTYTVANNFVVNILAATFFYIPIAGILLSTLITLRGWHY